MRNPNPTNRPPLGRVEAELDARLLAVWLKAWEIDAWEFERSQLYARSVEALARDPDRRLQGLTDRQQFLVRIGSVYERWPSVERRDYGRRLARADREVQLICASPQSDVPTLDLIHAWSQPEAQELLRAWWEPAIRPAYAAAYEGTKAAMITTSGLKRGPHFKGGWDTVRHSQALLDFFTQSARAADAAQFSGQRLSSWNSSTWASLGVLYYLWRLP
jgi:hypothetical protein